MTDAISIKDSDSRLNCVCESYNTVLLFILVVPFGHKVKIIPIMQNELKETINHQKLFKKKPNKQTKTKHRETKRDKRTVLLKSGYRWPSEIIIQQVLKHKTYQTYSEISKGSFLTFNYVIRKLCSR